MQAYKYIKYLGKENFRILAEGERKKRLEEKGVTINDEVCHFPVITPNEESVICVRTDIYSKKKKKKQDRDPRYIATCIQSTDFCQRYSHDLVKNLEYNKW